MAQGQLRNPRRWQILGVLILAVFGVSLDNTVLTVALPTLARDLGASVSQLQWMVDAYILVYAGLLLVAGALIIYLLQPSSPFLFCISFSR